MRESPIFSRTYDLLCWLLPATNKFPRQQRFVLAAAVQRSVFGFQERLIEATRLPEPLMALRRADAELAKLRVYLRLCRDLDLLSMGQYEHVSRMVDEIGRLLGGWLRSEGKSPLRPPAPARSRLAKASET